MIYAQEISDNDIDTQYYDSGMAEEIIIHGKKEYDAGSIEAHVLNQINGTVSDRRTFIETEFLEDAGFRRTGDVKYRKSNAEEKTFSVLQGLVHLVSLGFVPMKSIMKAKNRYSNELKSIKVALERYTHPSENYLRAQQNLGKSFK